MSYENAVEAADHIKTILKGQKIGVIGVICGSGLGTYADTLIDAVSLPTVSIPHFAKSTVKGHDGQLVFGSTRSGVPIVCLKGRLHTYEGYSLEQTVHIVRVLKVLGVKTLVVTNAAGGINQSYKVGDLMVISDHINLPGMSGWNPLLGPNDERWGARFVPTNAIYSHPLRHEFFETVNDLRDKISREVHEGVYTYLTGPTYETSAEVRMIGMLGGDAVGMSSVPETITAQHAGMRSFGLSLITNVAIEARPLKGTDPVPDEKPAEPNHAEVVAEGIAAAQDVQILMDEFLKRVIKLD